MKMTTRKGHFDGPTTGPTCSEWFRESIRGIARAGIPIADLLADFSESTIRRKYFCDISHRLL